MKSVPSTTITVLLSAATLVAVTGCSVPEMPADIQSGITANDPAAFYKAGMFYDNLKNASNSSKWAKSAELYRKGAELGDAGCQRELGYAYQIGAGVPKDYGQARAWYMRAAEQNNADALHGLGYLYDEGLGVPRNYAVAKDYYERSSALGCAVAVNNLGFMYEKGHGVKVDKSKALKLYEQAAAMGNSVAKDNAANLRKEMAMQAPVSVAGKTFTYYPETHECIDEPCSIPEHNRPWSLTWRNANECKETSADGWITEYKYIKKSDTDAVIYWFTRRDVIGRDRATYLHFTSPTGGTASFEVESGGWRFGFRGTGTFSLH